ncbi:MAG: HugZ family pyridoxamine 5'-phosphate oxidase [Alphaproteobacteria bacterium]
MADPAAAQRARNLIRERQKVALSTASSRFDGWPYGSLVMVANDYDASPILLISDLSEHAKNLADDPRASLLFDGTTRRGADPLDGPRVSLLGRARISQAPHLRARYLSRHPAAARFAGFGDFRIYRFEVERAYLVEGFGRTRWFEPPALLFGADAELAGDLAQSEPGILAHMNENHADAIALYANRLLGRGGGGWRMTGIDPEGLEIRRHGGLARLTFETPLASAGEVRAVLTGLANKARAAPGR